MKKRTYKRIITMVTSLCLLLPSTVYATEATEQTGGQVSGNALAETPVDVKETVSDNNITYDDGEYVVYVETQEKEEVEEVLEQENVEDVEQVVSDEGNAEVFVAELTSEQAEALADVEGNVYVEENIDLFGAEKKVKSKIEKNEEKSEASAAKKKLKMKKKAAKENKKDKEAEWNIQMVHGDKVPLTQESANEKIKVAVMDSGVELLAAIPVEKMVNLVPDEQDLPYYMNDMTGHGTAVAGIINDIAPNAAIYSVKIMDNENRATLDRVVQGIYWCIENDVDIINMSFGTNVESKVLEKAVEDADKAGILLVSSAGNSGIEGVEYPAAFDEVIAVGAVDTSAQKTEESAVGEEVELAAPGEQIIADSMLGLQTVVSGTSMAAPHATAAAAVLWQKDKSRTPAFIRGLLAQSANSLGESNEYGNGLVDLEYALENYDVYATGYQEPVNEESIADEESSEYTEQNEELLIEENTTPIEMHEEVDYVEGRWGGHGEHKKLVDLAKGWYEFENWEVATIKLGAVYPDATDGGFKIDEKHKHNKNWHGGYSVNYVSNYRFATRLGKYAGETSDKNVCIRSKGQSADCFTQMKSQITISKVGNKTYGDVIPDYNTATVAMRKKYRKCFLYGMASHILTDTFAHSAYVKKDGKMVKLSNIANEDSPNVYPNRWIDAQEAMDMLLWNYDCKKMGSEIDFSPREEDWGKNRGYYLKNILKYAKAGAVGWEESALLDAYKALNYE